MNGPRLEPGFSLAQFLAQSMEEADCSSEVAAGICAELTRTIARCRSRPGQMCFINSVPLVEEALSAILPRGRVSPPPGTAQSMANAIFLNQGEVTICRVGSPRIWHGIMVLTELPAPPQAPIPVELVDFSPLDRVRPGGELLVTFLPWAISDLPLLVAMHRDGVIELGEAQAELFDTVVQTGSWWENLAKAEPLCALGRNHFLQVGPKWDHRRFRACLRDALSELEVWRFR